MDDMEKVRIARRHYNKKYMREYRKRTKAEGKTNLDDNYKHYWLRKYEEYKESGEV
jgi:rRNA pseudouridine-1189 N-methylase Emg1 (Nep1/Mra1 family)